MSKNKISPIQKDALKELINIAAGNAATALSKLINQIVITSVPELYFCRVEEVTKNIDDPEKLMRVFLFKMKGDLQGDVMLIFPPHEPPELADNKILRETGGVVMNACLGALRTFLGLNIAASDPDMATDMIGSLLSEVLAEMALNTEEIFEFKVNFNIGKKQNSGHLIFMFDPKTTKKILKKMNKI